MADDSPTGDSASLLASYLPAFLAADRHVHVAGSLVLDVAGPVVTAGASSVAAGLAQDLGNSGRLVAVAILAGAGRVHATALLQGLPAAGIGDLVPPLRYFAPCVHAVGSFTPARERWQREAQRLLGASDELKAIKLAIACSELAQMAARPVAQRCQLRAWAETLLAQLSPTMTTHRHWLENLEQLIGAVPH